MKSRNISKDDDLIDIGKLFKSLWKDKFIILIISVIFSITGYFYGESLPRYYETKINIRSTPKYLFEVYDSLYNYGGDLEIYHNGTDSIIENSTGNIRITNKDDDKYIVFQTSSFKSNFGESFYQKKFFLKNGNQ